LPSGGEPTPQMLKVGRVLGAFGIKGWVKIHSDTDPRDNILEYTPWFLWRNGQWQAVEVAEGQSQGKGIVVRFKGVDDRNMAETLVDIDIGIPTASLPALPEGEFYWRDLIGLQVVNVEGVLLGVIDKMLETGANDVMVVKPVNGSVDEVQRLVPWVLGQVVQRVEKDAKRIIVDWGVDY